MLFLTLCIRRFLHCEEGLIMYVITVVSKKWLFSISSRDDCGMIPSGPVPILNDVPVPHVVVVRGEPSPFVGQGKGSELSDIDP